MGAILHPLWLIATSIIFAGFYFLVKKHELIRKETIELQNQKSFFLNEIAILSGKKSVYFNGDQFSRNAHNFTEDLDVFGKFSLFSFISRASTALGISYLRSAFLLERDKNAEEIQKATTEVINKKLWHEKFLSTLFPLIESDHSKTQAVYDFSFEHEIPFEQAILIYNRLIPFLWIAAIAMGYFYGWVWTGGLAFGLLLVNFSIVGKYRDLSEAYFTRIEGVYRTLEPIEQAVELIVAENWKSSYCKKLSSQIPASGSEKNPIKTFGFLVKKLESRRNQFATVFLYLYSPFDVVQLVKLKKWNKENAGFFKSILEVIGEYELLCSYAITASNNPEWSFPNLLDSDSFRLSANFLGHPLLGSSNVYNDFDLNSKNRLSLITGSNMSGKSTFLRAIGTNVLLAYMGAPVCASKMSLSKGIELITYMRIKDDLSLSVSTFKAEINRVKLIVDAIESGGNYLFLIDEMLRGTNSEDKLKGAIALLRKIAKSNTYALVATHDLRATEVAEEYPEVIKNFYFEFRNVGDDLEFDYKIKAGVCQSFNASQLLRKAGLEI